MRRLLVLILATVVGLVVTAWLLGSALPVAHTATSAACLPASRSEVWEAVTAIEGQPEWRTGVESVEIISDRGRRRWREHGSWGEITMHEMSVTPETRFVGLIDPDDADFGGTWTYELSDCPGGTRLVITEDGEVYNPVFRLLSGYAWGHYATQEQYLTDLGRHFGAEVTVERVE